MKFRIETITPEKAKEYLGKNCINRKLNEKRVNAYAEDMKKGAWQLNGESIRFDKNGQLIDGQHRLSAIIRSQMPVQMVITSDIDDDITIYDRGRNRSVTDSLLLEGLDKSVANGECVAIAKLFYEVKNQTNVSDSTVKDFIFEHKDALLIVRSITRNSGGVVSGRVSIRNAAVGLALMTAIEQGFDETILMRWAEVVKTGFMENQGESAAIVFRNDLISGAVSFSRGHTLRVKGTYQAEKSIQDFIDKKKRRQSYINWDTPVYSNY